MNVDAELRFQFERVYFIMVTYRYYRSGTVGQTFSSDDFSELLDYLETGFRTKLQSGDYYISLNYENSNIINFMAGTSWPINDSNFEFAIEFAKQ
jgi:hypothetical protein